MIRVANYIDIYVLNSNNETNRVNFTLDEVITPEMLLLIKSILENNTPMHSHESDTKEEDKIAVQDRYSSEPKGGYSLSEFKYDNISGRFVGQKPLKPVKSEYSFLPESYDVPN